MKGRPRSAVPMDEVMRLREQGLGVRAISSQLKGEGYMVSYRTVYRRLTTCPPHYWDISEKPVDGKYSAICRKCGAKREYPAWLPDETEKKIIIGDDEETRVFAKKRGRPPKYA